jgi:glycosyltransferase involved in cell wall biosynthesis
MARNIKISIITVCYNSAATIEATIQSVLEQTHADIEYIIIDGGSSDQTMDIVRAYQDRISIVVSEKDKGMYDAMNKGIRMATGDVIGTLNSDDFFAAPDAVAAIADAFQQQPACQAVFGDVAFVSPKDPSRIIRHYSSRYFNIQRFRYGYMPPHPTFYVRRSCYENLGLYQTDYRIAADYELIMRFLYTHKVAYSYIPRVLVLMQAGGVSNRNLYSRYLLNKEIVRACRENNVRTHIFLLSFKYARKSLEYIRPLFGRRKSSGL